MQKRDKEIHMFNLLQISLATQIQLKNRYKNDKNIDMKLMLD